MKRGAAMRIGYACLAIGVRNSGQKSCILKNADQTRLSELIDYNLCSLENIIDYNMKNGIKLFRISSDLIPFGSNSINNLKWWELFDNKLKVIGNKIKSSGMRVSMHPGQYTVINSPHDDVVKRANQDLCYHARVLNSMALNGEHKIVLHMGGIYQEKEQAMDRFITNYHQLNETVKERLVIENDDKSYHIGDVLKIGKALKIPVVFDNLHHAINPCDEKRTDIFWINECGKTWKEKDGLQKIHYSQQDPQKKRGSHSSTIRINEFLGFYESLERKDLDIMLEVKDKNLSAIKCIHCTSTDTKTKALEVEWSRYKYPVLENSQETYLQIRTLLRDKDPCSPVSFYSLIEYALQREPDIGNSVNAALHVWGYFKEKATEKEKVKFLKDMAAFERGEMSIHLIKNSLWRFALKYRQEYLLDSYYFVL